MECCHELGCLMHCYNQLNTTTTFQGMTFDWNYSWLLVPFIYFIGFALTVDAFAYEQSMPKTRNTGWVFWFLVWVFTPLWIAPVLTVNLLIASVMLSLSPVWRRSDLID